MFRALAGAGHAIDITRLMTLTYQGTPLDTEGVTAVDAFAYNRSVPNPTSYRWKELCNAVFGKRIEIPPYL